MYIYIYIHTYIHTYYYYLLETVFKLMRRACPHQKLLSSVFFADAAVVPSFSRRERTSPSPWASSPWAQVGIDTLAIIQHYMNDDM